MQIWFFTKTVKVVGICINLYFPRFEKEPTMKIIWMLLMSSGSGSGPTSHTFILSEMTKIAPLVRNIERIRNFHIDIYIYIYIYLLKFTTFLQFTRITTQSQVKNDLRFDLQLLSQVVLPFHFKLLLKGELLFEVELLIWSQITIRSRITNL